jgi:hypothetical protein
LIGGGDGWRDRYREFVEADDPVVPPPGYEKLCSSATPADLSV